jgi:hypothetical protein
MKVKYNKKKIIGISIHLFVWTALFLLPYLLFPMQENNINRLFKYSLLPLMQYAIIFYLNYFIFLNRYLFQKKYILYFLINILLILIFLWINWQFRDFFLKDRMQNMAPPELMQNGPQGNMMPSNRMHKPPVDFFMFKDIFSFFIPVIVSIAVKATENWFKTETEKKEIENKNLESELQHLRYQLQPHFFFNSLNNIYSLIEVSPSKAQEAIHNLSKLMRYLLYDTQHEKVELSEEINFLKKFIQLMELRQTDRTKTNFIFPETENTSYRIAPLLFIPMIENAYKHGVSATQESHISFEMSIKYNQLFFSSENTNFPKKANDISGSGIGLENLRKRLELVYPNKFVLKKGIRNNIFWITLQIELN